MFETLQPLTREQAALMVQNLQAGNVALVLMDPSGVAALFKPTPELGPMEADMLCVEVEVEGPRIIGPKALTPMQAEVVQVWFKGTWDLVSEEWHKHLGLEPSGSPSVVNHVMATDAIGELKPDIEA